MAQKTTELLSLIKGQPVIPVLIIDDLKDAVPLARALAKGGLKAIEVTLRTPVALDAIERIANEVPEAIVGAGTVLDFLQFEAAEKAGARFIVSPGLSMELIDSAENSEVPLLPGAMTPSEFMSALEEGYNFLKFFPAEQAGGIEFIKAIASPFADIIFCPTGGINVNTAGAWLKLPNVKCVGGSWIAPKDFIKAGDFDAITKLAQHAAGLVK